MSDLSSERDACYNCGELFDAAVCEANGCWECASCGAEPCAICGYDHEYASNFAAWREIEASHAAENEVVRR